MLVTFDDIIASSSSEEAFLQIFQRAFQQQEQALLDSHRTILIACYRNPGLAPSLKGKETAEILAQAWLKKYSDGFKNRISQRISKQPGTVADPIIDTIINARLTGLTSEHLEQIKFAHRLSMSAENIQGLLLEEFLAVQLEPYGWFCCWGESVRHVDFCNIDGSLLQIKNRSNSENSSSSRVRINQPIEMWYCVDAKTGADQWSFFNEKHDTDQFSENHFVKFVQQVLTTNPNALAIESDNPWQAIADA